MKCSYVDGFSVSTYPTSKKSLLCVHEIQNPDSVTQQTIVLFQEESWREEEED
jgi:hypothetical protein